LKSDQIAHIVLVALIAALIVSGMDLSTAVGVQAEYYNPIGWLQTPRLVLYKSKQILELHERDGKRTYHVCLGYHPKGAKRKTGDRRTPEGRYYICNKNPNSGYHRFLGINYPNKKDAQRAFETGRISLSTRNYIIDGLEKDGQPPWDTKLGGWVGIHGYPSNSYLKTWVVIMCPKPQNWTDGCVAMWDYEIEELYRRVPVGTPITILP
jgi:murein L,D-transpeptidase YafK